MATVATDETKRSTGGAQSVTMQPLAFSVPEAARALGISKTLAYEAAYRGEIPTIRVGSRVLVPRAALERMLAGVESAA
jgi:excisionase family DNA binding protein